MAQYGILYGVGTGPGDPELMTLKAIKVLASADVIAHFAKRRMSQSAVAAGMNETGALTTEEPKGATICANRGNALETAEHWIRPGAMQLSLLYPVTTELDHRSNDYARLIEDFFDAASDRVASHLRQGRDVAVLSEGDPLFYGSYMHLHVRLKAQFQCVVIPGITAMSGCWSLAGLPLVQGEDALTILPGTMPQEQLTERLAQSEALVIMKVGRNLGKIRQALKVAGKLERAVYVERGTMAGGFHKPLIDHAGETAPYFSLILVPGWRSKP